MPELPEIEFYRRLAERSGLGRRISKVVAGDEWFIKGATTKRLLQTHLKGVTFDRAWRIGKLLLLDTSNGDVLGLRFGMTGVLVINNEVGVSDMQYGSHRLLPEWNRFNVIFDDGGVFAINDPRRLGGVELDPDISKMGIDALTADASAFESAAKSTAPLKAWLMNQDRIAGVGNLLADEILWCAGFDPARPAKSLTDKDITKLAKTTVKTVQLLVDRGGSHMGDLMPERKRDGHCPKDGAVLQRRTIGGRTSYSCPQHQL
jgi:formamidopyrimidine-DNA glycosylase